MKKEIIDLNMALESLEEDLMEYKNIIIDRLEKEIERDMPFMGLESAYNDSKFKSVLKSILHSFNTHSPTPYLDVRLASMSTARIKTEPTQHTFNLTIAENIKKCIRGIVDSTKIDTTISTTLAEGYKVQASLNYLIEALQSKRELMSRNSICFTLATLIILPPIGLCMLIGHLVLLNEYSIISSVNNAEELLNKVDVDILARIMYMCIHKMATGEYPKDDTPNVRNLDKIRLTLTNKIRDLEDTYLYRKKPFYVLSYDEKVNLVNFVSTFKDDIITINNYNTIKATGVYKLYAKYMIDRNEALSGDINTIEFLEKAIDVCKLLDTYYKTVIKCSNNMVKDMAKM